MSGASGKESRSSGTGFDRRGQARETFCRNQDDIVVSS